MRALNALVQLLAADVPAPRLPRAGAGLPSPRPAEPQHRRRISLQHLPRTGFHLPGRCCWLGAAPSPGAGATSALGSRPLPGAALGASGAFTPPGRAGCSPSPCLGFCSALSRTQAFVQRLQPCGVRWSSPRLSLLRLWDEGCVHRIRAFDRLPWLKPVLSCTARTRCCYFFFPSLEINEIRNAES